MREKGELISDDLEVQAGEARDELVQLAAGSADATLYGLAVGQCRGLFSRGASLGACSRISLSRWTQLDPDNATPWLALAQAAHAAGDTQAEAAAMEKAAQGQQMSSPVESLLSLPGSEMPHDLRWWWYWRAAR